MYNIYQKHEPSEEWKELESWTQTNLGVEAIYWERESFFAIRMALRAIHVKEGDYLLLSALSHPLVYQAARSLGCQILFIDVNQNNAQLNLEVLEHFLSLATIVNEKDELIYRKDNACIRAIILDYPLAVYQGAETLVFTAQRYQLKVLEDFSGLPLKGRHKGKGPGTHGDLSLTRLKYGTILLKNPARPSLSLGLGSGIIDTSFLENYINPSRMALEPQEARTIFYDLMYSPDSPEQVLSEAAPQLLKASNFASWEGNSNTALNIYFTAQNEGMDTLADSIGYQLESLMPDRSKELKEHTFLNKNKVALKFLAEAVIFRDVQNYFE